MINLNKSLEYFKPSSLGNARCHIIGCGSVGGNVAVNLARLGVTKLTLWDFDTVEAHNIANQIYRQKDIGQTKVSALAAILNEINPDMDIRQMEDGWDGQKLSGYVFLAPDNIEVRQRIVTENQYNTGVKAMFDFRTRLEDAQAFAADWSNPTEIDNFFRTMDFTHEEAAEATPVSACGTTLGVGSIPRMIADIGVNNFLNFVRGKGLKKLILMDGFNFTVDAF